MLLSKLNHPILTRAKKEAWIVRCQECFGKKNIFGSKGYATARTKNQEHTAAHRCTQDCCPGRQKNQEHEATCHSEGKVEKSMSNFESGTCEAYPPTLIRGTDGSTGDQNLIFR